MVVHALAAACILAVLAGWAGVALSAATVGLGAATAWDRALLRSRRSPRAIEVLGAGPAYCLFANGESAELQPYGGSAVTRYWVAFGLRSPRRRSLFIAPGMLAPESLRLLRLWALWGRMPGVARQHLPGRPG